MSASSGQACRTDWRRVARVARGIIQHMHTYTGSTCTPVQTVHRNQYMKACADCTCNPSETVRPKMYGLHMQTRADCTCIAVQASA